MIEGLVRESFLGLIRLFYPRIEIEGAARIPPGGPVLVVANHPNGLLDPLIICAALGRPVGFLAKSTLFKNPAGRLAMNAFGAIPVYRPKDGQDTRQNDATFAQARTQLFSGRWLALFPEGISHSETELQPLKTGAARIALGAEAERRFELGLRILPLGLIYEEKQTFRSRVALAVGEPFTIADLAGAHASDERAAVQALTARIHEGLARVVLEAETEELWRGFLAVASWTADPPTTALAAVTPRAQALASAYRQVSAEAPARAERVVEATRHFVRTLQAIGVRDPLALEAPAPTSGQIARAALPLFTLWPAALVGALLGWLPYRLVRPLANRLARGEVDIVGTLKLLLGLTVMAAAYGAEAIVAGLIAGPWAGVLVFALAPLCGFTALRYGELVALRREALEAWWLRVTSARLAAAIAARRAELAAAIEAELAQAGPP